MDKRTLNRRVRNILKWWDAADLEAVEEGLYWYKTAETFCKGLRDRYDHKAPVSSAAGIVAALSPQVSWERNQVLAERVARYLPVEGQTEANVRKAERCRDGENPLEVLGGPKVRAFYLCILGADSSVCIDRHATALAEGSTDLRSNTRLLERKGGYEAFVMAYQQAAVQRNVTPQQMQAVTWVYYRKCKGDLH